MHEEWWQKIYCVLVSDQMDAPSFENEILHSGGLKDDTKKFTTESLTWNSSFIGHHDTKINISNHFKQ